MRNGRLLAEDNPNTLMNKFNIDVSPLHLTDKLFLRLK